ncbi:thioesterase family protein [Nocardia panacis]|uniref:Thioesterase family protein n=1 Tax=Nocardia panacis TaxID=2340916 RepID=A0A3A4KJ76_9NOCA|nr:thioesterase family protein [Nocardia panacis]RJO76684.1 thioesterase family protein [Nocardia panacis]
MVEGFYLPEGDGRFLATELTRGPWSMDAQHGGPPAALLGHVLEGCAPREEFRIGRVAVEILGPVPLAQVRVAARVVRPGRSVEMLEATLESERGLVMRAVAWRFRVAEGQVEVPPAFAPNERRPGPERESSEFPTAHAVGFHKGLEYRFVSGSFTEPGPAVCWMRLRYPIVAGTTPSPWERVLVAADHGNGISSVLGWDSYVFINTDLTVQLHRMPEGEWVCLDAVTHAQPEGVGLAESALFDEKGPIGRSTQTLHLARR